MFWSVINHHKLSKTSKYTSGEKKGNYNTQPGHTSIATQWSMFTYIRTSTTTTEKNDQQNRALYTSWISMDIFIFCCLSKNQQMFEYENVRCGIYLITTHQQLTQSEAGKVWCIYLNWVREGKKTHAYIAQSVNLLPQTCHTAPQQTGSNIWEKNSFQILPMRTHMLLEPY